MKALRELGQLLSGLTPWGAVIELVVLAACFGGAYLLVRYLRGNERLEQSIWFGRRVFDGVLFPLLALVAALAARWGLQKLIPIALLDLAMPVLISLLLIRLSVRVMQVAFPQSRWVRRIERTVSWVIWIGLVLWLTGVLPLLARELEQVHWHVGGVDMSMLTLLQGGFSALMVLLVALWLSAAVEASLLRGAVGHDISARKIAANAVRAVLLLVGLLLAMSAAGIPLSALSVLGGAFGVGVGLGLQKIAANYVSGFVILAEHALRIGDMVKVDGFEGRITDIKARYTVIRSLGGHESIVPNDMLITQRVENSSLADANVALSTSVQVAYGTDLEVLLPQLQALLATVPRVLSSPAPGVQLAAFGDSGLVLRLLFWIGDPHNGQGNIVSAVNLAVLAALNRAGVEIPYPQRVVHRLAAAVPSAPPSAAA